MRLQNTIIKNKTEINLFRDSVFNGQLGFHIANPNDKNRAFINMHKQRDKNKTPKNDG